MGTQQVTLTELDCHKTVTPDKQGRCYLTEDLAGERVHVYAVRDENAPDPDIEGASRAIESVAADVDGDAEETLRAALAALGRVPEGE